MIKKAEWLTISNDRTMVIMLVLIALATIFVIVTSLLRIHVSDVQIPSRYSAYGTTNIYRSHWYTLYMFPVFALLVAGMNGYIAVKVHSVNRLVAVGATSISLAIIIMCLIIANAVFNLAPTV